MREQIVVGQTTSPRPRISRLQYLGAKRETPTVATFRFGMDERFVDRQPGQYCSILLDDVNDLRGPSRLFTISSSPTEKEQIIITTRLRGSPFKERLLAAAPGESFQVRGPFGKFVLDTTRPVVMLAGGIGITPFRSMIRYASDLGLKQPIVLLYSNRTAEEIVFREELERLSQTHGSLRMLITVTRPDESEEPWHGSAGRIDAAMIKQETGGLEDPLYYICGPPAMVEGMANNLRRELATPPEIIRQEKFDGY